MLKLTSLVAAGVLLAALPAMAQTGAVPGYLSAAASDPGRPAADMARDAERKPAQTLAFGGVKPGDKVIEIAPGGGYFTRVLAQAVGPSGRVYAYVPVGPDGKPMGLDRANALAASYPNVTVQTGQLTAVTAPEPVDLVFTAQNFHDFHIGPDGPATVAGFDNSVFAALKPGGVFLVVDHASAPGAGIAAAGTLHRMDEQLAKSDIEAAGFVLDGESPILHNTTDPHTAKVFDPVIRGHTDQFLLRFKKPG